MRRGTTARTAPVPPFLPQRAAHQIQVLTRDPVLREPGIVGLGLFLLPQAFGLARVEDHVAQAESFDARNDVAPCHFADRQHANHAGDTEDDPESREQGTRLVQEQIRRRFTNELEQVHLAPPHP